MRLISLLIALFIGAGSAGSVSAAKYVDFISGEQKEAIGSIDDSLNVGDYWLNHAIKVIKSTYGDTVSVDRKNKDLHKFGHNDIVGTTAATLAHMPGTEVEETFVASNLINSIVSSSASDTTDAVIEGHTVSGGVFTFVVQTVTLTGQTAASLGTALARVTRVYNDSATDWIGRISVTETDTYTAGVPDTDTKVHLQVEEGENQSEKASTTISNTDYWIITEVYADFLDKTSGAAEILFQVRLQGKVFRNRIRISTTNGFQGIHTFKPYFIVPKNSDVRVQAVADGASTSISGGMMGVLATVVE